MQQLKRDKCRLILKADKGVAMVVKDKQDYIAKAKNLLEQPAYRPLPADLTNKYKAKFPSCLCGISTRQLELLLWRAAPQPNICKIPQSSLYS